MKKNMIALAVAGALVAPVAMADVTVSGGLQAELVQIGGNGSQPNGLYAADGFEMGKENSGNYGFLKFSASEDLGGDMKALAVYDLNANVGDSTKAGLDTRDAYVGLSMGSMGAVLAGTLATPYKSSTVKYDPMLATSFQARGNYGMSGLQNGYVSNAVAYANSFAGGMVKVVAALVLDEAQKNDGLTATPTDKTVGKHAKSFSVNIAPMSGLDIAVAYIDVTNFGNANVDVPLSSQKDVNATKVGAQYKMGAFTVAGQVEMLNKGMTYTAKKSNTAYVTGSFDINEANTISVAVGRTGKDQTAYEDAVNPTYWMANNDAKYAAVMFKHAFSKNTSVHAGYRLSDTGTVSERDIVTGLPTGASYSEKESAVGAGLRVNF